MRVNVYTDGACSGNPGKGGYGIVMEWVGKPYKKEFSEGYRLTTNNRHKLCQAGPSRLRPVRCPSGDPWWRGDSPATPRVH